MKNWFAVYTKPRWEKKVNAVLLKKAIESYCPMQRVQRQWSDRKKIVEDPLFKSYVFVHTSEEERLNVLQTDGIINFVHYLGKPAIIRDEEIDLIKAYLLEKEAIISIQSINNFRQHDKVIVRQGVFMDNTGTVIKSGTKKVYVQLESLGQVMVVEFPMSFVSPVVER